MEKKDNSNRNAWIIWGIIFVVIIGYFVISVLIGIATTIMSIDTTNTSTSVSSRNTIATSNKNTKTTPSHTYNMNEIVKTDYWQVQILSVENKKELKREFFGSKKTDNNYLLIKMKLKNLSNEPNCPTRGITSTTSSYFKIETSSIFEVHSGTAKYYSDMELGNYISNSNTLFDTINPNTEVEYTVAIETDKPSTESNYILEIHDDSSYVTKIHLYQ